MARRLNRKVAFLGLLVLIPILGVGAWIAYDKIIPKDPNKLLATARAAMDEKDYAGAGKAYAKAYHAAKADTLKVEILYELSRYHQVHSTDVDTADPAYHEADWAKAVQCWRTVTQIDPSDANARRKMLDYYYEAGDSGNSQAWDAVLTTASEFLDMLTAEGRKVDPFVRKARARALLEKAQLGQTSDRMQTLAEAREQLRQLKEDQPEDPDIYQYLARAETLQGRWQAAQGDPSAREESYRRAEEILRQAVDAAPANAQAHIALLRMRLQQVQDDPPQLASLMPDFEALVTTFPTDPSVYLSLADYHQVAGDIEQALIAVEQGREVAPQDIALAMAAANFHYLLGMRNSDADRVMQAVAILEEAVQYPDARPLPGPTQYANRRNRFTLNSLLASWCLEQAITMDANRSQWLARAEKAVGEIESMIGTENNVQMRKWKGLLVYARGEHAEGVRQMYNTYQTLTAAGQTDATLAYYLAYALRDRPEVGLRSRLLRDALMASADPSNVAWQRTDVLLEFARLQLELRNFKTAEDAAVTQEQRFGSSKESRRVLVAALLGQGKFNPAQEQIGAIEDKQEALTLQLDVVNAQLAQAQRERITLEQAADAGAAVDAVRQRITQFEQKREELVLQLLQEAPRELTFKELSAVTSQWVLNGRQQQAKEAIQQYRKHFPDDLYVAAYLATLQEPAPQDVPFERKVEITEEVIRSLHPDDPVARSLALADQYMGLEMTDAAQREYEAVLAAEPGNARAVEGLFDLALLAQKYERAAELAGKAKQLNLDECQGRYFSARLLYTQGQYDQALTELDQALRLQPVFANALLLRSKISESTGKMQQAMQDISRAVELNPLHPVIAKQNAALWHRRVVELGDTAGSDVLGNARTAIQTAMFLNPRDWQIQSLYAEFIYSEASDQNAANRERLEKQALAMRQRLQQTFPTLQNHLLLGKMAMRMAEDKPAGERTALLEMAGSAFEKAHRLEPDSQEVQTLLSEYLRITNQQEKAAQLFGNESPVLWKFYLRDGQHDKAARLLEEQYAANPKDPELLKGLIAVARITSDEQQLKRYLSELLAVEPTVDNELLLIQLYLENGLEPEQTRQRLASFRERHPEDSRGLLMEAWQVLREGRMDEALTLTNRALELDPESAIGWRLRGQIYRLQGDYPKALQDLQKSNGLQSTSEVRIELAQVYRQMGQATTAIGELKDAMQSGQKTQKVLTTLEAMYRQTGRTKDLQAFYADILSKDPDSPHWNYQAGQFLMTNGQYREAEKFLQTAWDNCQKEPSDAAKLDLYLETLMRQQKYEELFKLASQYTDGEFGPVTYAQMAQARAAAGDQRRARQHYSQALEKCAGQPQLVMGVLQNMSQMLGPDAVRQWCADQLRDDPQAIGANLMMFQMAVRQQQFNEAIQYIQRCVDQVEPGDDTWAQYRINKANALVMAYMKTADERYLTQAIQEFEEILRVQPLNTSVMNNLAYLLADSNDRIDQAVDYARRAQQAKPNDANRMDTLAYALVRSGDFGKGEEMARQAIQYHEIAGQQVPWSVYEHLAMALEGLGRSEQALTAYRKALELAADQIPTKKEELLKEAVSRLSK